MVHVSHTLGLMSVTVLLRFFFIQTWCPVLFVYVCARVCVCVWYFLLAFHFF